MAQTSAYKVEVEKEGCANCGQGKQWVVVGPDGVAGSITYENLDDAEEDAEIRNEVHETAQRSAIAKIADDFYRASGIEGGEFDVTGTKWGPRELIEAVRNQVRSGYEGQLRRVAEAVRKECHEDPDEGWPSDARLDAIIKQVKE